MVLRMTVRTSPDSATTPISSGMRAAPSSPAKQAVQRARVQFVSSYREV